MAQFSRTLMMTLAVVLGTAELAMAETRAERNLRPAGAVRVADMPAGHWATNATQVALANEILTLDEGTFQGDRLLTADELAQAIDALVRTAEAIGSKGVNETLRAGLAQRPSGSGTVSRLTVAQTLASFLDACASQELVAIAAPNHDASRFSDVGASVPPAVTTVVDKFKVMTGYPDNTFRPDVLVSRYQMAAIAFNILNGMRMAPIAQLQVQTSDGQTIIVVQNPTNPETVVVTGPVGRMNFRERAPIHLSWQAINNGSNLAVAPFAAVPLMGMLTLYNGPLMLQNVTNVRVNPYTSNMVDNEIRAGYAGFKWGMLQAIPYVGARLGVGTSPTPGNLQYDSYGGASYGGIVSITPLDTLEFHAHLGQTQLLSAGRFTSAFQPVAYPNALGSVLTDYGLGADFYIAPNICLTLGVNTWQNPAALRTGNQTNLQGVIDTFGGNLGIGSKF